MVDFPVGGALWYQRDWKGRKYVYLCFNNINH